MEVISVGVSMTESRQGGALEMVIGHEVTEVYL